jgi:hypothetical protein
MEFLLHWERRVLPIRWLSPCPPQAFTDYPAATEVQYCLHAPENGINLQQRSLMISAGLKQRLIFFPLLE